MAVLATVGLLISCRSAGGARPYKQSPAATAIDTKTAGDSANDKLAAEILPPQGAETVKQFLMKNGVPINKKLVYAKLSIAYHEQGMAKSMVKVITSEFGPRPLEVVRAGILIGYRVPPVVSTKIGDIELGFADRTTLTVLITPDYFYIRLGERDIPFKSVALSRHIKELMINRMGKQDTTSYRKRGRR